MEMVGESGHVCGLCTDKFVHIELWFMSYGL